MLRIGLMSEGRWSDFLANCEYSKSACVAEKLAIEFYDPTAWQQTPKDLLKAESKW